MAVDRKGDRDKHANYCNSVIACSRDSSWRQLRQWRVPQALCAVGLVLLPCLMSIHRIKRRGHFEYMWLCWRVSRSNLQWALHHSRIIGSQAVLHLP